MHSLSNLKNTSRPRKKVQRVGRGFGSRRGRTSGRGQKGDGARSGYKRRYGYEGGQVPLYRKVPVRGFTRGRFEKLVTAVNLDQLEAAYKDGETVNAATLREKGLAPRLSLGGVKILGVGELTRNVTLEVHGLSASARAKLDARKIAYKLLGE